ncbi:MAG: hypothetical protein ABIR79_15450 [Candidatus Binatia bacterium]
MTWIGELATEGGPNGAVYFANMHEVKGKLFGQSFDEVYDGVDD